MGRKTLAILVGDNGRRYRIRKWADRHATLCAEYGRPGSICVQDPETHEWNHLSWWSVAADFGNQPDEEVMEEAMKRLRMAFGVKPKEIIYDQHRPETRPEPTGVSVRSLSTTPP